MCQIMCLVQAEYKQVDTYLAQWVKESNAEEKRVKEEQMSLRLDDMEARKSNPIRKDGL